MFLKPMNILLFKFSALTELKSPNLNT
jgi:hypothetical protein